MAVIKDIGVGISIRVDKKALPEHDDPEFHVSRNADGIWACKKYIEAISNAEFDIQIRIELVPDSHWIWEHQSPALACLVVVDGIKVEGRSIRKTDIDKPSGQGIFHISGQTQPGATWDSCTMRKFKFCPIDIGLCAGKLGVKGAN